MEKAIIGPGKVEGPYTEIANLTIEREPKFPVRRDIGRPLSTLLIIIKRFTAGDSRELADPAPRTLTENTKKLRLQNA